MICTKYDLLRTFMYCRFGVRFINLQLNKLPHTMKIKQFSYEAPECEVYALCPAGVLAASFTGEKLTEDDTDSAGEWLGINY